ncbi:MAG TPA: hypothetical protein VFX58_09220 [Chitinophagaceae bacterium]|nr:hypothetical protein [Chitinophagaceae bacterium]
MKTTLMLAAAALAFMAFGLNDMLTGRWETRPSLKGNITGIVFKPDHTYEGYINKKPFVSGRYILKDSLITIKEYGCEDKTGIYKLVLFHHSDSLRFQAVNDSCTPRREGMTRLVFGRVK